MKKVFSLLVLIITLLVLVGCSKKVDDIDAKDIGKFKEIKDQEGLTVYLSAYEKADRRGWGGKNDGKK